MSKSCSFLVMAKKLDIPTTNCNYFDYLRIEKSQRRGKALQKLQRKLEESLIQTTSYIDTLEEPSVQSQEERDGFPARIGCSNDLPELSAVLEELEGKDLRHIRLSILISASQDSLSTFLDQAFILFDKDLGNNHISEDSFLQLLSTHLFLSNKVLRHLLIEFFFSSLHFACLNQMINKFNELPIILFI